ncbi:MAG: TonB family protein [Candidatus Acidiferrales bacterium]
MKRALGPVLSLVATALIFITAPRFAFPQQERPGVPPPVAEPDFTITRHGTILFEANIAAPGPESASRVLLTESIEISGVKAGQGWLDFIHAFAASTSRTLLDTMPPSASAKKGKVIVAFALRRDGSVEGAVSITHSSGDPSVDDAARLAIAKAAPFGALPQDFPRALAQFRVTLAYDHPHPLPPADGAAQ